MPPTFPNSPEAGTTASTITPPNQPHTLPEPTAPPGSLAHLLTACPLPPADYPAPFPDTCTPTLQADAPQRVSEWPGFAADVNSWARSQLMASNLVDTPAPAAAMYPLQQGGLPGGLPVPVTSDEGVRMQLSNLRSEVGDSHVRGGVVVVMYVCPASSMFFRMPAPNWVQIRPQLYCTPDLLVKTFILYCHHRCGILLGNAGHGGSTGTVRAVRAGPPADHNPAHPTCRLPLPGHYPPAATWQ